MIIYDSTGIALSHFTDVPVTSSTELVQELMRSDYVQLSFNSPTSEKLPAGAYILPFGEYGEKYSLLEPYSPDQKNEAEWVYKPQFHSEFYGLSKVPFFMYTTIQSVTTKEADWVLTDNPANFMERVCYAILTETGLKYTYSVGQDITISSATVQFNCVDIISACSMIANAFETELWLEKFNEPDESGYIGRLHLSKASLGTAKTLEVGSNIKVPSVTKNGEFYNRFYIFGSSRNIAQDSQSSGVSGLATKRLVLDATEYPDSCLDYSNNGPAYSRVLQFDDIYPAATNLVIYDSRVWLKYKRDDEGNKIPLGTTPETYETYPVWFVQLKYKNGSSYDDFTFDEGSVLPGLVPSFHFTSGSLNGREFEVIYHGEATHTERDGGDGQTITIKQGDFEIKFLEEGSFIIPNYPNLAPTDDDYVILFNVEMPESYIETAQARLLAAAEAEINKNYIDTTSLLQIDKNSYQVASDPTVFHSIDPGLFLGCTITYINGSYSKITRVTGLKKRLDLPCYQTIVFGDDIVKGNIEELKDEAASANKDIDFLSELSKSTSTLVAAYERTHQLLLQQLADAGSIWQREQYTENGITKYRAKLNVTLTGAYTEGFLSAGGIGGPGGGGGASALSQLSDVALGALTNGDLLAYDLASGKWKNIAQSSITPDLTGYVNSLVVSGSGNYVSGISKSGKVLTATMGTLPTTWAWSAITGKPTTLSGYGITDVKFGTAGTDYVPVTLGSSTKNVLTAHQSLSAYLTSAAAASTYQPLDADLTAIAALTGNGFLKKTSGTWGMDNTAYVPTTRTVNGKALSSNITIAGRELSDASDMFFKAANDPGVDVTIADDPGTTGTVLWGAESTYRVALDVNGVSKTLLKGAALDSVYSRLSSLEGYFSGGVANNAWLLEGFSASHFATNDVVTTSANGLMSSADKSKLDGIAEGATNVTEATVAAWGFTKNTSAGTVTSIAIGAGTTPYTPASSGLVTLPGSFPASDVYAWAKKSSLDAADVPNLSYTKITGLGAAAVRGIATAIGANENNLVPGSLLYNVLGDAFDSTNTVKAFVNSSISTATATFRGTNTTATTESAFLTWANGLTHDLNDYVFWGTVDSVGNTVYKRYKFNGTSWEFEYDLNNSSFTATQWSAISSGITSSKVGNYDTVYGYFTSGILPVSHGGTGLSTLTSGYALIGNGANAVSLRAITNNTSATAVAASTNLITANTLYYHKGNSNINTVGTITSGTWQGTAIANTYIANPKVTINGSDVALGGSFNTSSITAGTAGTSSATSGATLAVPYLTLNQYGIVTGYGTHTHTINNLPNTALQTPWVKIGSTTVNLGDTITNLAAMGTIEATSTLTVGSGHTALTDADKVYRRIYFGSTDYYLEIDKNGYLHSNVGFYSDSFVSAGGIGSGGGGGGASALSQLTDVALGELSNGDFLSYNLASNKWVNLAIGIALGSGGTPYRPSNGIITLPAYNFSNIAGTATASQVPSIENLTNFSTRVYDATRSRTANTVLAAPNGSNGAATFRKLVAADIPSLTKSKISDFPTTWALANITDADDLKAIEALTGTSGYLKKTAANTWSLVTAIAKSDLASAVQTSLGKADTALQSHQTLYDLVIKNSEGTVQITYKPATNATYEVTLTKAMVGLSNVDNIKLSTWAGSQNITTLGTIATGVWNGTAIAANKLAIDLNWSLIGNSATYADDDYIHVN